jgi:hypothetical protein
MTKGVIYYATGEYYIKEAELSAESLKKVMPEIDITLYGDSEPESEYFDNFVKIKQHQHPWLHRISCLKNTPYEKTLFLDSDTYVCEEIGELFEILDRFDIAAVHGPGRYNEKYDYQRATTEAFPDFNCGVILFNKNPEIIDVFSQWEKKYKEYVDTQLTDQPFFSDAVYNSNLSVCILPPEYNCRFMWPGYLNGSAKILHGRDRANYQETATTLNHRQNKPRVHTGGNHRRVYYKDDANFTRAKKYPGSLLKRFLELIKEEGAIETVDKIVEWIKKEWVR